MAIQKTTKETPTMKTLVLYYSYSGNTKKIAEELAQKECADIEEIKDKKRPGKLKVYTAGIIAVMRNKSWSIQPLSVDLAAYDRIILLAPVWADSPPPPVGSALELLPEGKTVAVKMISASGKSGCVSKLEEKIKSKGSVMESFEDIKV